MKTYVFRQRRTALYHQVDTSDFVIIDGLPKALNYKSVLLGHFGMLGYFKQLVKSLSSNRIFYCLLRRGKIVASGTLAIGFCNYYDVGSNDVVIGSIWTDRHFRGQGLASRGVRAAVNHMIVGGATTFYIDTQETNMAMLRAIQKIGFGEPVSAYEK